MRIIFCNNSFPGQFEGLARHFAFRPDHDVLFASSYGRRDFSLPGVRRILLRNAHERAPQGKDEFTRQWIRAVHTGRDARNAFMQLAQSGFEPDMVLFSSGCGESLFLKEVFPRSFRVAYLDFDRSTPEPGGDRPEDEKRNFALLAQSMTLLQGHAAFTFSGDERNIPAFLRPVVGIVPPFVDTDFFSPEHAGAFLSEGFDFSRVEELVSFDMKGLPATDHAYTVAARLLLQRPACHVLITCRGQDGADLPPDHPLPETARACPGRLHIRNMLRRYEYRNMLAASTVHVSPSSDCRPTELLEALSCETILMARPSSSGSGAFLPGKTMLAWPDTPEDQLRTLVHALDERREMASLRRNGREAVRADHDQARILPRHAARLLTACKRWKASLA